MSYAICMVLASRGWSCEGCPMPFVWFWLVLLRIVQDAICMVLASRGCNCGGYPMPFAWFWPVVCHLHACGKLVVARIVRDARCHLHGFGKSWLEL